MLLWLPAILIRLLVPLSIFIFPFWGSIASVVSDSVDVFIWNALKAPNLPVYYNFIDKALDNYFYLIQGYIVLKWQNKIAKKTALFLLIYRTFGFILYEITKIRALLFIFPNVFIFYFIFYLLIKKFYNHDPAKNWKSNLIFLGIITVPKLGQEYVMHVLEFNFFRWFLKATGL